MYNVFRHLFANSTRLDATQLAHMCEGGHVLEQDERGPKVIELTTGDFLKIFRARHLISGARAYSHARRFYRNALRLNDLKIPTVHVKCLFHLDASGQTAVLYQPLVGKSLRDLIHHDIGSLANKAETLGDFLATLHLNGIHFHSLHTGNILLQPNGRFALIDISDMTIYPWPLMCITRYRSFNRLCKYREDIQCLGQDYWDRMLAQYFKSSMTSPRCQSKIGTCSHF